MVIRATSAMRRGFDDNDRQNARKYRMTSPQIAACHAHVFPKFGKIIAAHQTANALS